jgi:hypothetical protein
MFTCYTCDILCFFYYLRGRHVMFYDVFCDVHVIYMLVFFTGRYLVLGEPRLVQRTITDGDKIYMGSGPREASKCRTSSCYSCIACIRRGCDYNVAMPMRESMITIGDNASYLYPRSTFPRS